MFHKCKQIQSPCWCACCMQQSRPCFLFSLSLPVWLYFEGRIPLCHQFYHPPALYNGASSRKTSNVAIHGDWNAINSSPKCSQTFFTRVHRECSLPPMLKYRASTSIDVDMICRYSLIVPNVSIRACWSAVLCWPLELSLLEDVTVWNHLNISDGILHQWHEGQTLLHPRYGL